MAGRGWRLILAGGSHGDNPYLRQVRQFLADNPGLPVELRVNITAAELQELYRRASLFWHFCGLGQNDPALVEHFGMTVAEAMQSGCIPLVFDGGGMREIVRSAENGYLFSSVVELAGTTVRLFNEPALRAGLAAAAWSAGKGFSKEAFAGACEPWSGSCCPGAMSPGAPADLSWTERVVCVIFPKMNITGRIEISLVIPSTTRRRASPSSLNSSAASAPAWGSPMRSSSSTTAAPTDRSRS